VVFSQESAWRKAKSKEDVMSLPLVAIVAFDDFGPYQISIPCVVFGNFLPGIELFNLKICAGERGLLRSAVGLSIETEDGLDCIAAADIVVVPFWRAPSERPSQALLDAIATAHRRGACIVGLCLGTYVLGYAGVLNGRRVVTHWEVEEDFASRFPDVRLDVNALYVDDDGIITSAGTGAGMDCCLYVVRTIYGPAMANAVARRLVLPPQREGRQVQLIEQPVPPSQRDARINLLLDELRSNLARDYNLDDLASRTGMSRRSFTRHFFRVTGMSFGQWFMAERMRVSRGILETTAHNIETVAEIVGYQSTASFRQHFKAHFGISPRNCRHSRRAGTET
jgi:transcriptional regulator GlxA family with amidase domain